MVSVKNANAMAEVLHYLKGIRQEDINKIPKTFIQYLRENASKEYKCNFDFTKPLKDLELLDETRGIIERICYNYWCVTEEQKAQYLKIINQNEKRNQEEFRKKYNSNNIFNNKQKRIITENINSPIEIKKETFFKKLISFIKRLFNKNN